MPNKKLSIPAATFLISAAGPKQFPDPERPEIVFAGRSNVGKSSLLNRLLNRRKLARTSSTPGRTQLINFFEVGRDLMFVDIPGYGYAKVPQAVKKTWRPLVESYLSADRDIRLIILLIDIRRDPGPEESDLLDWLEDQELTYQIVATKADKIKRSQRVKRLSAIQNALSLDSKPSLFSALTGEGVEELWTEINEVKLLNECN